jgi:hypothetical protein
VLDRGTATNLAGENACTLNRSPKGRRDIGGSRWPFRLGDSSWQPCLSAYAEDAFCRGIPEISTNTDLTLGHITSKAMRVQFVDDGLKP